MAGVNHFGGSVSVSKNPVSDHPTFPLASEQFIVQLYSVFAWTVGVKLANCPDEIEHLVSQLGSSVYKKRSKARKQLTAIGGPAIPALIQGLQSESQRIRAYSAHILGNIGNKDHIPDLEKALRDEDEHVRKNAKEAIAKIQSRNRWQI